MKNDENKIIMQCVIEKKVFLEMFDSYDFKTTVERCLVEEIINKLPSDTLNELIKRIDLEAVVKLATIRLSQDTANRHNR